MWWMIALLGCFLILCALPLFPIVTSFFFPLREKEPFESPPEPVGRVDVLIPCHNEHGALKKTLTSVQKAIGEAQNLFPDVNVEVIIGLDDCTDNTLEDTRDFSAHVLNFSHRCKWLVLRDLVHHSRADWLAFVDAGTLWDARLLRNTLPYFSEPDVMCISPSYQREDAGFLSRSFWTLEALLKTIENRSGGPVSVHGSTVFYRRKELLSAFMILNGRRWINDDVVLPLALRMIFPQQKNLYCRNRCGGFAVCDSTRCNPNQEKYARARMAEGNLQWLRCLLPIVKTLNPLTIVFALRRIFRLAWAMIPLSLCLSAFSFVFEKLIDGQDRLLSGSIIFLLLGGLLLLFRQPAFSASWRSVLSLLRDQSSPEEEVRWS